MVSSRAERFVEDLGVGALFGIGLGAPAAVAAADRTTSGARAGPRREAARPKPRRLPKPPTEESASTGRQAYGLWDCWERRARVLSSSSFAFAFGFRFALCRRLWLCASAVFFAAFVRHFVADHRDHDVDAVLLRLRRGASLLRRWVSSTCSSVVVEEPLLSLLPALLVEQAAASSSCADPRDRRHVPSSSAATTSSTTSGTGRRSSPPGPSLGQLVPVAIRQIRPRGGAVIVLDRAAPRLGFDQPDALRSP